VNSFIVNLIQEQTASKGKLKVEDLVQLFQEDDTKEGMTTVIQDNLPKAKRSPREKKLVDPEAPKRPASNYLLFTMEKRAEVKEAHPELKGPQIISKLGDMWQALSAKKKEKYTKKFEENKAKYQEAMKGYVRPADEELVTLDVNNKKPRGRKSSGETKKKPKDKDAPKGARSAYMFFGMEKRKEFKEQGIEGKDVTVAVNLAWKDDYVTVEDRAKWIKMAEEDKKRFVKEMEAYKGKSAPVTPVTPVKGKKVKTPEPEDEEPEEAPVEKKGRKTATPKPETRRTRKTVEVIIPASEDSDAEEEQVPVPVHTRKLPAVCVPKASVPKVKTPEPVEVEDAELFGDEEDQE